MHNALLIGAGGHAISLFPSIEGLNTHLTIVAPDEESAGLPSEFGDVAHCKTDEEALELGAGFGPAYNGLGLIKNQTRQRATIFERYERAGFAFPTVIHHSCILSSSVSIGAGSQIFPGVVMNPLARVGNNCVINTGAIIEHQCVIEDHAFIAPGAILCGDVFVGRGAVVGAGAVCLPGAIIKEQSIVKAGTRFG